MTEKGGRKMTEMHNASPLKRRKNAVPEGNEYCIYRIKVDGKYVPAHKGQTGCIKDAFVQRYLRSIGFKGTKDDESDIRKNDLIHGALASSTVTVDVIANSVRSQSLFECFTLKHLANTKYGEWLQSVVDSFDLNGFPKEKVRGRKKRSPLCLQASSLFCPG
jgi:hypothetical protein